MSNWVIYASVGTAIVLAALGLHLAAWASRRKLAERLAFSTEPLEALGLKRVNERWLFGTRMLRFVGTIDEFPVEAEAGASVEDEYARFFLTFPDGISLRVRIQTEERDDFWNRVLALRETQIGDERFDPHFILLSREAERLDALLTPRLRAQLLELQGHVDEVRIADAGIFVFVDRFPSAAEASIICRQMTELATVLMTRSAELREDLGDDDAGPFSRPVAGPEPAADV